MNQVQETTPLKVDVPEMVQVSDMNTLVQLIARWHTRKVKNLEYYLQIPDGQIIQVGEDPEFTITGDVRKGFITGINMALMEVGILPFSFELEDAASEAPVTAGGGLPGDPNGTQASAADAVQP